MGAVYPIDPSNKPLMEKFQNMFNGPGMKAWEVDLGKPSPDFNYGYGVDLDEK